MLIQVVFGKKTDAFNCSSRREFLTKVRSHYGLATAELQLYDISDNFHKKITINDLQDKMKVELRTLFTTTVSPNMNGERSEIESTVKVPQNKDELIQKFVENRVLSGLERKFLIYLVENYYDNGGKFKRKRDDASVSTANKKVQIDLSHQKQSISTQTEAIGRNQPSTSQPSTSRDFITECKRLAKCDKKDPDKVQELMDETYDARRHFIFHDRPVVSLVKEKYPLLFSTAEVRNELNRIFYIGKDEEFLRNIEKFSDSILSLVDEDDYMLKIVKEKIKACVTPTQKKYAKEVGALLILSNLLREKRMFVSTEDEPITKNNHPYIDAACKVNKLFYDIHLFKIIVEGVLVCEASNFKEAILCLIASYFIFNIVYPQEAFNSLVVIERVLLEANDTNINEIDDQTKQIIRLIQLKTNVKSLDK